MPKVYLNPGSLFPSLEHGFSQVVAASGGKTIYISGQTAWDIHKQVIGGRDLGQQARQALRNVQTAVEAAGGTRFTGYVYLADSKSPGLEALFPTHQ